MAHVLTSEEKEILYRGLPKWPQMYTTGIPVTAEQAKEIIRRTDYFFSSPFAGGNDRAFDKKWHSRFGMPDRDDYNAWSQMEAQYHKLWEYISTDYVNNSWISSSFIGGPHGWCSPTGAIGYTDNVGKHPGGDQVYEDWVKIAKAFPFLKIGVTLMDKEDCEEDKLPVISLAISNGEVTVHDPQVVNVHEGHPIPKRWDMDQAMMNIAFDSRNREHGLSTEWLEDYEKHAKKIQRFFIMT